jgi:hypothetical protein
MLPNETLDAVTKGREGFEYDEDGNFRGAGGREAMDLFILHSIVSYLRLEIKTGMKMTAKASTLRKANEMLGTNYKRKQQALDHLEAVLVMAGELPNPPKEGK